MATGTFRDPLTNSVLLNAGAALESQSVGPPVSDAEMGHSGRDWNQAASQIAGVKPLQLSANVPQSLDGLDRRTQLPRVIPGSVRYARCNAGADRDGDRVVRTDRVLGPHRRSTGQRRNYDAYRTGTRGRSVFNNVNCNVCHVGQMFGDNQFHNIGVRPQNEDTGRFQTTNDPANLGEFRTPSLRNVELRAPYMHNGRFASLEEVVNFYDRGGDFPNAANFPNNLSGHAACRRSKRRISSRFSNGR